MHCYFAHQPTGVNTTTQELAKFLRVAISAALPYLVIPFDNSA